MVVSTAAAASGVVGIATAAEGAPPLTALEPHQGETLLKMTRRVFPHKQLDDGPYWSVVRDVDAAAKADSAVAKLISEGVETLDAAGKRFVDLTEKEQTAALKKIEATLHSQGLQRPDLASRSSRIRQPEAGLRRKRWLPTQRMMTR